MAASNVGHKTTLEELKSLTDMQIGAMGIDDTRRMLKEAVPLGLIQLRNDQIDNLTPREASTRLNEARRTAQRSVNS